MRSVWKGSISFGLVSIPIKLYSATEEKDISFHQVHAADGGRIKYKRVCTVDGEEVPYSDISKGYERADGTTVVLTDDDFAALPIPSARIIDVLTFVPEDQIDPIALSKSYYAEPSGDAKPYVLLRDTLAKAGRVAVVKIALRQRERLATMRVQGDVLVLQTMLWPDEVRAPELVGLDDGVKVRPQEIAMASSYVDALSGDFDADEYHDDYRAAVKSLADAKAGGKPLQEVPLAGDDGRVVDLMEALRASVEAAKGKRAPGKKAASGAPRKKASTTRKKAAPAAKATGARRKTA